MKNIKYFLLLIFLSLCISSHNDKNDSTKNKFGYIETEKDIKNKSLNSLINRELDLYSYDISIGSAVPLKGNLRNNFNIGQSISFFIKTPYKTPKLINRYEFNIGAEIAFSKMSHKPSFERSSFNATSMHLILNNKTRIINLSYGLGFAQLFSSETNILAPSFKIKAEYELKLFNWYLFLTNNGILDKNKEALDFLQNLHIYAGFDPQITFGFPFNGRTGELIIFSDIYLKVNLFNL